MSYRGKVILCGDPNVGKSSLLAQYVDNQFSEDYVATVGANFLIKEIDLSSIVNKLEITNPKLREDIKQKGFKLYFWDLGGQHDKLFSNEYYFVQAVGAFIIYDILDRDSFENVNFWFQKVKELSGEIPIIILGNKIDRNNERTVSYEEAEKKANEFGVDCIETSAKTNENVDKAFESLAILILNNLR
ncbi:MAG: Rab family GTPase [Candidatus Hermodarchaeota archaeon]